ncbi:MAG: hypothetical protein CMP07_03630 [Xanthomonadales bacterium]|nr:hypothetical protein [Xanthomonadales bacterium]|tara:strand:+ start:1734 stop:2093 length:360 start_codon:yes stop_codon:yes gene_type:complete
MHATAETNTAAVISLVSGILAWVAVPLLGSLVAVFTGHAALNQIRASGGLESGEGLAAAGLVLGWLQLGLLLLALVGWIVFAAVAGLVGGFTLLLLVGLGLLFAAGLAGLLWMLFLGVA